MADNGCDDILITFPHVGVGKAERFAALANAARVAVNVEIAPVPARGLVR